MVNLCEFKHVIDLLDLAASPANVDRALRSEGLGRNVLRQGPGFLPQKLEAAVVEHVARAIGDRRLGARIAPDFDYSTYGAYARYVLGAPNLFVALEHGRRALSLIYPGSEIVLREHGSHFLVGRRSGLNSVVGWCHLDDGAIFIIGKVMRHFLGPKWRPPWIELPNGDAAYAAPMEEMTGAPVRNGSEMPAVAVRLSDLNAPNPMPPSAEQVLSLNELAALMGVQPPNTMAEAVKQVLLTQLVLGDLAEESVARRLSLGRRTLQRALSSEATSFREIKGQLIEARARTLLAETQLEIEAIARALGYAEPNSFRRAFRGWTGLTPNAFRAGLGHGAPHVRPGSTTSRPGRPSEAEWSP